MNNNDRVYFSIDFETGGFNETSTCITEFGIAVIKGYNIIESMGSLIKPYDKYDLKALRYSNISESELKKCKFELIDMVNLFIALSKKYKGKGKYAQPHLVGHNIIRFDKRFLKNAFERCNKNWEEYFGFLLHDTLVITDEIFCNDMKLRDRKLGTVCNYLGIDTGQSHSAEDDAIACGKLFIKFNKYYSQYFDKLKIMRSL